MVFCFFVLSKSKSNSSTVFPLHASIGNHNPLRIPKCNFILCSVDTTMIIKFRIPTKHHSVAYFYLHTDLFYICARATILIPLHSLPKLFAGGYPANGCLTKIDTQIFTTGGGGVEPLYTTQHRASNQKVKHTPYKILLWCAVVQQCTAALHAS